MDIEIDDVKIGLQLKVTLENLTNLRPEGDDFRWYLKLKCLNCGEETKEFQYLTLTESTPLKGGRGSASLVVKCKLCSRENSIDIIQESVTPYNAEHDRTFKTIVVFDCRGVEPTTFSPRIGWVAQSSGSGTQFNEVDLTDEEWVEYDEKIRESVGVYEIEHQFVKVK